MQPKKQLNKVDGIIRSPNMVLNMFTCLLFVYIYCLHLAAFSVWTATMFIALIDMIDNVEWMLLFSLWTLN